VHGEEGLLAAKRITDALFSGALNDLSRGDLEQLKLDGLPSSSIGRGDLVEKPMTQLLVDCGMVNSGKQVKDALARNSVLINGAAVGSEDNMKVAECFSPQHALHDGYYIVRLGKKKYHLITFS
jgi:tyrosyl-tRNA synthetase